ncbi:MAG: phage tail protein [Pseudomonadota bacterium]
MSLVARVVAVIQTIGADIKALQAASNGAGIPTGAIAYFPSTTAPAGWMKTNGALLNRAAYPELYAYAVASGNMAASDAAWQAGQFSPGDGSTTFRIPDLRGEFLRGLDDGRGVDTGRAIGSDQEDDFKTHSHAQYASAVFISGGGVGAARGMYGGATVQNPGTLSTGGTETRPRNVAMLACIKY